MKVSGRPFTAPAEVVKLAKEKQDHAGAAEESNQAEGAPKVSRTARSIADHRFVGPVVRVGVVLAGPVGDGRPGRPCEVGIESLQLGRVLDVGRGESRRRGGAAEVRVPFSLLDLERGGLAGTEDEAVGRGVVTVLLEDLPGRNGRGLELFGRQLAGQAARALAGEPLAANLGEAVEVFRAVVGPEVGAVTPQRPVLHQAVLEEHLLAVEDGLPVEERRPRRVRHAPRNRGRVRVGEDGHDRKDGEAADHHEDRGVSPPR